MTDCTLHLPFPVSVNGMYANAHNRGRIKTEPYCEWQEAAGWGVRAQRPPRIKGPVSIFYTFGKKSGRWDLSNFIKAIEDLLVNLEVIEDDNSKIIRDFHVTQDQSIDGVSVRIVAVPELGEAA